MDRVLTRHVRVFPCARILGRRGRKWAGKRWLYAVLGEYYDVFGALGMVCILGLLANLDHVQCRTSPASLNCHTDAAVVLGHGNEHVMVVRDVLSCRVVEMHVW
jgi:hypothetical protein